MRCVGSYIVGLVELKKVPSENYPWFVVGDIEAFWNNVPCW